MPVIPGMWITLEVKIRRTVVHGQPGQEVSKTPSQPISHAWWHTPFIPAMQGV
jgi:hypothetical protein